jgi:hypothetical protein
MLNQLTDNSNAAEVLDYLSNRGELLFFFIQQFPSIKEIVKKQFSAGIRPFCSECRSGNCQTASCCARVLSPTSRPCLHKNGIHNWMAWMT